jgi:hypothetical protein
MKTSKILLIIIAILVILPLTGRLIWEFKKSQVLDIMIINKTVPNVSENELKGLNWALNMNKYVRSTKYLYHYKTDYYGYHPDAINNELMIRAFQLDQIKNIADKNQAIFYIDNEGVDIEGKGLLGRRTWYGGLNQNDYLLIKEMHENNKLILAEYNFFSEPTEDLVRYNTEQLIDIFYVGWKGKYFKNLDSSFASVDLKGKWFETYKQNTGNDWSFNGPGIILINDAQNRIIVLPSSECMNSRYPEVITEPDQVSVYNIPASAAYTGWFNIVYQGKNNIVSQFDLNLNERGIKLLHNNGLSPVFPAVICSADKRIYFIAGDFSKSHVCLAGSKICIFTPLIMKNIWGKFTGNPNLFFQTYYSRLLSTVLNDYHSETNIQ